MDDLNVGDIVALRHPGAHLSDFEARDRLNSGIILDIMDMADGFPMIEVCFGTTIQWYQDLELELVQQ